MEIANRCNARTDSKLSYMHIYLYTMLKINIYRYWQSSLVRLSMYIFALIANNQKGQFPMVKMLLHQLNNTILFLRITILFREFSYSRTALACDPPATGNHKPRRAYPNCILKRSETVRNISDQLRKKIKKRDWRQTIERIASDFPTRRPCFPVLSVFLRKYMYIFSPFYGHQFYFIYTVQYVR